MDKKEMINRIAEEKGCKKVEAEEFLKVMENVFTEAFENKEEFTIPGVGKVNYSKKSERKVSNPQDGKFLGVLPAHIMPKIKLTKGIKDMFKPEIKTQ